VTFVKSRVICDGCGYDSHHDAFQESIIDHDRDPWIRASVNVRGYCMVFTFCPKCAMNPMIIPPAAEIVRRVKEILR
jgi:hypothetical protein